MTAKMCVTLDNKKARSLCSSFAAFCSPPTMSQIDLESVFDGIFSSRAWAGGDPNETIFGSGSRIEEAWPLVDFLEKELWEGAGILDIACGDCAWVAHLLRRLKKVDYTGVHLSDHALEAAQANLQGMGRLYKFLDDVPASVLEGVDVILVKDHLQHICNRQVLHLMDRLCAINGGRTKIYTIGTKTCPPVDWSDIRDGGYRAVVHHRFPLRLYHPEVVFTYGIKEVCLVDPQELNAPAPHPQGDPEDILVGIWLGDRAPNPLFWEGVLALRHSKIFMHLSIIASSPESKEAAERFCTEHGKQYASYTVTPILGTGEQEQEGEVFGSWVFFNLWLSDCDRQGISKLLCLHPDEVLVPGWLPAALDLRLPIVAPMLQGCEYNSRGRTNFQIHLADAVLLRQVRGILEANELRGSFLLSLDLLPPECGRFSFRTRTRPGQAPEESTVQGLLVAAAKERKIPLCLDNRLFWGAIFAPGGANRDYCTVGFLERLHRESRRANWAWSQTDTYVFNTKPLF